MSRLRATDPVRVELGPCECPGTPHEQDEAYLRPRLTPEGAMRATAALIDAGQGGDEKKAEAVIGMAFLVDGLVSWNILDDDGEPIRTDEFFLRSGAIDWETLAPIADKADELYSSSVVDPLVRRLRGSSQTGQTDESISQTPESSTTTPTPSEPSTT